MSEPTQVETGTKLCATCGLEYAASLSHGMVDCVAEFRAEINRLRVELVRERARRKTAEEVLDEVRAALRSAE